MRTPQLDNMRDLECPYCDEWQEVNHDDGQGYSEDETHQMQCRDCGKYFTFTTGVLYVYSPERADCLNDSEHDYQLTTTYPKFFSKMRCSMCQEERQLTEAERKEYKLDNQLTDHNIVDKE